MKKALFVTDGLHDISTAFEFISRMHAANPLMLTGAFLPQMDIANTWAYSSPDGAIYSPPIDDMDVAVVDENIADFKLHCDARGIRYRLHRELYKEALPTLRLESRFADIMFMCGQDYYNSLSFSTPSDYMRDILHDVECPVILVPEKGHYPESVVLAYDGSRSSAYAIRAFAALCPHWCTLPASLVYTTRHTPDEIPFESYILELAHAHFPQLSTYRVTAEARDDFAGWLTQRQRPIMVSGAFGRSGISQLFHHSFAAAIVADKKIPLFIAHQ